MSIKVTVDYYTDLCRGTLYGEHILELPDEIQDAINDFFEGIGEIDLNGGEFHPDNVVVNMLVELDLDEAVPEFKLMDENELAAQIENDTLSQWFEDHANEVADTVDEEHAFLGVAGKKLYYLL